ncbi:MAG: transposase [Rhabdochlamydiaceae bacterium]
MAKRETTENGSTGIPEREHKRWTASRKMEIVLRHMRGESLDSLSREVGMAASQIEEWNHAAMRGIEGSLKSRCGEPLQAELDLAKKRIGELSMENELLKERSRRQGVFLGGKWK